MTMPSRGLLAGFDIECLKQRNQQAPYDQLWAYFVSRWEGIAAREAETDGYMVYSGLGWPSITPMLPEAALIYRLTGRADALAYVTRLLGYVVHEYREVKALAQRTRGETWLWSHSDMALAADLCRDALPENLHTAVLELMPEFIAHRDLRASLCGHGAGGNIPLGQTITAALCALTWGEDCGCQDWEDVVDLTADAVEQYVRHGSDEQGFWYEGSCYGGVVYSYLIFPFAQLYLQAGRGDLFARLPILERVGDATQQMMMPNCDFAATTGDGGTNAPYGSWFLLLTAKHYNRPDHLGEWHSCHGPDHPIRPWGDIWPWMARFRGEDERALKHQDNNLLFTVLHYDADAAVTPREASTTPTTLIGHGTGTAVFRTSWRKNATFAIFLGGGRDRVCHGHAHADAGHFGISVGGEYLAIDTGRYNTNEDQHNVVLIEGENRFPSSAEGKGMGFDRRSGRFKRVMQHKLLDRCCADASLMKGVIWALRDFFFVRLGGDDAYIVTFDNINVDDQVHRYEWRLGAHPDATIELSGEHTAVVRGEKARLDCTFFQKLENPAPEMPHRLALRCDRGEWVWPYGRDVDMSIYEGWGSHFSVIERPLLVVEHESVSCNLAAVIVPRRAGHPELSVRQFPVANGIGLEVQSEQYVDRFFIAPDHAYLACDHAHGFAEFAMERRNLAGDVVEQWVEDGGRVTFEGAPTAARELGNGS